MRMRVRIGEIGREVKMPEVCPYQGCGGTISSGTSRDVRREYETSSIRS